MLAILTITFNKARGFSEVNPKWAVRQRFRVLSTRVGRSPLAGATQGKLLRNETLMRLFATKGL